MHRKNTIYSLILLISCFLFGGSINSKLKAQASYPVQANVYLAPPYSNHLSDYYTTSKEKLVVTLLNRDQQKPLLDVRLRVTVSAANGMKLQSREEVNFPTIQLDANIPVRLTQEDLAPYFQPSNVIAQGLLSQGRLPEGMVEFTVQAIEKHTNKIVSAPATGRVWLSLQKPPILRLPSNNEYIAFNDLLHIKFQWEPLHKNISQVEYEFELKELPNNGVAPQSSYPYALPIYRERLVYTYLMYSPVMPPLQPDKTYAWCVRAIAKDGVDALNMFENNGYSEIYTFRTTSTCQPPFNCISDLKDRRLTLSWTPSENNNEYLVQYRLKNATDPKWNEGKTYETTSTLYDMQRGATYEFRVGSICTAGQPVFTPVGEITIPAVDSVRLANCGKPGIFSLENKEPLENLQAGQIVMVNDYPMYVTQVSGGNGTFTGEGWIPVNWLLNTKWQVEFNNIRINTDKQLIGGSVRAKYDESESQIANVDEITSGGHENTREGIFIPDFTLKVTIPENPTFEYSHETREITIFSTDGKPLEEKISLYTQGVQTFPITIKDKDGNIYILNTKEEQSLLYATEKGNESLFNSEDPIKNNLIDTIIKIKNKIIPELVADIIQINEFSNFEKKEIEYINGAIKNTDYIFNHTEIVSHTNSGAVGWYENNKLYISYLGRESEGDLKVTIFHEYLHHINYLLKVFPYRYSSEEAREIFEVRDECYTFREPDLDDYYVNFMGRLNNRLMNEDWPDECSELTDSQMNELMEYVEKNKIKDKKCFVGRYRPSNYFRDEIFVYNICLKLNNLLYNMSSNKISQYLKNLKEYETLLNQSVEYEKRKGYDEKGYKNER